MGRSISNDLDVSYISDASVDAPGQAESIGLIDSSIASAGAWPDVAYKMSPVSSRAAWYWFWRGLSSTVNTKVVASSVPFTSCAATGVQLEACTLATDDIGHKDSVETSSSDHERWLDDWTDDTPYSNEAELPSIGSAQHWDGTCQRCCFFPKGRCANGVSCEFCHYSHEKRRPAKPRAKHTRRRARRQLQEIGGAEHPHVEFGTFPSNRIQLQDAVLGEGMCRVAQLQDAVVGEGTVQLPAAVLGQGQVLHAPLSGNSQTILGVLQLAC